MKKFLSSVGSFFNKVLVDLSAVSPIAGLFATLFGGSTNKIVSVAATDIKNAFGIVASVEAVDQAITGQSGNGAAKLKAAAPQVGVLLQTAIDEMGLKIADETAASMAVTNITSNLADLLNACAKK